MAWKKSSYILNNKDEKFEVFVTNIDLERFYILFNKLGSEINAIKIFSEYYIESLKNTIDPLTLEQLSSLCKYINSIDNLPSTIEGYRIITTFFNTRFDSKYTLDPNISKLIAQLIDKKSNSIYMPFHIELDFIENANTKNKKIYTEAMDIGLIQEFLKIFDNINIEHQCNNPIICPKYTQSSNKLIQFDSSIAITAFKDINTYKYFDILKKDTYNRFKQYKGNAYDVAYIEHTLSQTLNQAIFYLPIGFTYKSGAEQKLRKYLIDNNLVESIIQFAPNTNLKTYKTTFEACLLIVNKNKKFNNVKFLNLRHDKFLKIINKRISLNNIDEIISIYHSKNEYENIFSIVTNEFIKNKEFSFSIDKYILSKKSKLLNAELRKHKLIELQNIATIKKSQLFKNEQEGEFIFELSPSDFSDAGLTFEYNGRAKKIKKNKKINTYQLENSDILLSTKGTIGKVALVCITDKQCITSQASVIIRLYESNPDKKFSKAIELYMYLKSNLGQNVLKELVSGTSMPLISTNDIKKLLIPIVTTEKSKNIIQNYSNEIRLMDKITSLQNEVQTIHTNYSKASS